MPVAGSDGSGAQSAPVSTRSFGIYRISRSQRPKGFALDIPAGYGSQKSGARSQNGGGVRAQEPTDFFQGRGQCLGVSVSEVFGENEKVTAFLGRSLGDIQEASLVGFADAGIPRQCWPESIPLPDAFAAKGRRFLAAEMRW